jgi:hypothetical protein
MLRILGYSAENDNPIRRAIGAAALAAPLTKSNVDDTFWYEMIRF